MGAVRHGAEDGPDGRDEDGREDALDKQRIVVASLEDAVDGNRAEIIEAHDGEKACELHKRNRPSQLIHRRDQNNHLRKGKEDLYFVAAIIEESYNDALEPGERLEQRCRL